MLAFLEDYITSYLLPFYEWYWSTIANDISVDVYDADAKLNQLRKKVLRNEQSAEFNTFYQHTFFSTYVNLIPMQELYSTSVHDQENAIPPKFAEMCIEGTECLSLKRTIFYTIEIEVYRYYLTQLLIEVAMTNCGDQYNNNNNDDDDDDDTEDGNNFVKLNVVNVECLQIIYYIAGAAMRKTLGVVRSFLETSKEYHNLFLTEDSITDNEVIKKDINSILAKIATVIFITFNQSKN